MQTIIGFITSKYVYIVALAIGLLSIANWRETKSKWRRILLAIVILCTTIPSLWEMATYRKYEDGP